MTRFTVRQDPENLEEFVLADEAIGKSAPLDRESAVRMFDGLMLAFEIWGIERDHKHSPHVLRRAARSREALRPSKHRQLEL